MTETDLERIRRKWGEYDPPQYVDEKCQEATKQIQDFLLQLLSIIRGHNTIDQKRYLDLSRNAGLVVGLLAFTSVMVGLEYERKERTLTTDIQKVSDLPNEALELLIIAASPASEFAMQMIGGCIASRALSEAEAREYGEAANNLLLVAAIDCYKIGIDVAPSSHQASGHAGSKLLYNFAHIALPLLTLGNPKKLYQDLSGSNGQSYLIGIWEGLANKLRAMMPPDRPTLSQRALHSDAELFIIQTPRPSAPPETFYVGIVFQVKRKFLGKEVASVRYFTLELGSSPLDQSQEYHFCEWVTRQDHRNYGQLPNPMQATFIEAISRSL